MFKYLTPSLLVDEIYFAYLLSKVIALVDEGAYATGVCLKKSTFIFSKKKKIILPVRRE